MSKHQRNLISVTYEEDGEIITMYPDGTHKPIEPPPDNGVAYDANGISIETSHGCVRFKLVDDYVAQLAAGDEFEQGVAAIADIWFATFINGYEYSEEDQLLLTRNYQQDQNGPSFASGWLGGYMFEQFYASMERDPNDIKAPFLILHEQELEKYVTPIFGFSPYDHQTNAPIEYIKKLVKQVDAARRAKPGSPKVGPRPPG